MVGTDDSVQESNVFITVGDMFKIFHADDSDSVLQIIHESVILINKDDAALAGFHRAVCNVNHLFCLSAAFMSH